MNETNDETKPSKKQRKAPESPGLKFFAVCAAVGGVLGLLLYMQPGAPGPYTRSVPRIR